MTTTPSPEHRATEPQATEPQATEPHATRVTTGERLSWMAKNSKILIVALVVIVIAVLVATFSFSLFTSSSANPGNVVGSGSMTVNNSGEGKAILTAENLLPGQSTDGTVSITNVGDADGDFTLSASNLTDTPSDPGLSGALTLVVTQDGTGEIYNGLLAAFSEEDLGTWEAGEAHEFTFAVTMDSNAGNDYQDAKTTLDFTWDATQSS
jgi:hypothetical protein